MTIKFATIPGLARTPEPASPLAPLEAHAILDALTRHFRPQDELAARLVLQAARVLAELAAGDPRVASAVNSILDPNPSKAAEHCRHLLPRIRTLLTGQPKPSARRISIDDPTSTTTHLHRLELLQRLLQSNRKAA